MNKFGIIGAEEQEIELFKPYFEGNVVKKCGLTVYDGKIFGRDVVFACAGIGKVNACLCTQVLISNFDAEGIINCGIAGAISHDLSVLDMVVSEKAFQHDVDATYFGYALGQVPRTPSVFTVASAALVNATIAAYKNLQSGMIHFDRKRAAPPSLESDLQKSKIVKGTIASGDMFVTTAAQREKILGICAETSCVEMEGAAIAQAASVNNVPFVIIRSISDTADENTLERMSYDEFSKRAAAMATSVILEMLQVGMETF